MLRALLDISIFLRILSEIARNLSSFARPERRSSSSVFSSAQSGLKRRQSSILQGAARPLSNRTKRVARNTPMVKIMISMRYGRTLIILSCRSNLAVAEVRRVRTGQLASWVVPDCWSWDVSQIRSSVRTIRFYLLRHHRHLESLRCWLGARR
jgi:hypothetical protein